MYRVLEAKDMALKLRQIHDTLQGEVKHKIKRLVDMKRTVEERNSQVQRLKTNTIFGLVCFKVKVDVSSRFRGCIVLL